MAQNVTQKLIQSHLVDGDMRAGAEIEYVGKFADGAPASTEPATAAAQQPAAQEPAEQGTSVAADDDAAAISKGLSGIK